MHDYFNKVCIPSARQYMIIIALYSLTDFPFGVSSVLEIFLDTEFHRGAEAKRNMINWRIAFCFFDDLMNGPRL